MERKKILVVDDDPNCRKEVITFCKKCRIDVDSAESGKGGIDYISLNNYIAIFIDFNMPDLNGFETARLMAEVSKEKLGYLVLMSGDVFLKEDYEKYGFVQYVTKPLTKKAFDSVLNKWVIRK